jgi:hypothetical protein
MRKVGSLTFAVGPLLAAAAVGCASPDQSDQVVREVDPPSAYNDASFAIRLYGTNLRPPLAIDPHSGSAGVPDGAFDITLQPIDPAGGQNSARASQIAWISGAEIDARLSEGLLPGDYQVSVRDVHGQPIESHAVFRSLGPDNDPPHVTIVRPAPGTLVGPGAQIHVVATIDDGTAPLDGARWTATSTGDPLTGTCSVDADGHTCPFMFPAPESNSPVVPVDIRVDVTDEVGHSATAEVEVRVVSSPSISTVTPATGSTLGGTAIVIDGMDLLPGLARILVDGQPICGLVSGDSISGVMPAHGAGLAQISVTNGYGASAPLDFTYVSPPVLRLVSPTHAPSAADVVVYVAGNDFTPHPRFSFDQGGETWPIPPLTNAAGSMPPYAIYDGPNEYTLHLGPGSGSITLNAEDDVGGPSPPLDDAFTYDPPPTP